MCAYAGGLFFFGIAMFVPLYFCGPVSPLVEFVGHVVGFFVAFLVLFFLREYTESGPFVLGVITFIAVFGFYIYAMAVAP